MKYLDKSMFSAKGDYLHDPLRDESPAKCLLISQKMSARNDNQLFSWLCLLPFNVSNDGLLFKILNVIGMYQKRAKCFQNHGEVQRIFYGSHSHIKYLFFHFVYSVSFSILASLPELLNLLSLCSKPSSRYEFPFLFLFIENMFY